MPRLNWIRVKGFRAFVEPQQLDLPGLMAVVWAPNSQGKTSLAEAVEFLLTGKTIRRELATSAVREFSDCLRNAHLPDSESVEVSAEVVDASGQARIIRRVLTADYAAHRSCEHELFIDDVAADDLSSVGIFLSPPPLEAPILMQHTLRYALMAQPQERTDYFKALLEISDLEDVRSRISSSKSTLPAPPSALIQKLDTLVAHVQLREHLQPLRTQQPHQQRLEQGFRTALGAAFPPGTALPDGVDERAALLKQRLEEKRRATFPLEGLESRQPSALQEPAVTIWSDLDAFFEARTKGDKETARLADLFTAALATTGVGDIAQPVDCPVCETAGALTPARIAAIRAQLEASREYQTALAAAGRSLRTIQALPGEVARIVGFMKPPLAAWPETDPRRREFTVAGMEALLGDSGRALIDRWKTDASPLKQSASALESAAEDLRQTSSKLTVQALTSEQVTDLKEKVRAVMLSMKTASDVATRYRAAETALADALRIAIDRKTQLGDWKDLVDLTEKRQELFVCLIHAQARRAVVARLDKAIEDIDEAKGVVLDEKFAGLGTDIQRWWNLLRPGEPVGFGGVDRTGTGRRYLDLKAKLLPRVDSTDPPQLRNAVAVFSDSQLNCLGLGAFLARTSRERSGFVVLDDPVPASDEEHKGMFVAKVLEELLREGIQVLLLSHDKTLWRDVQSRYQHLQLDVFQVAIHQPAEGAVVEKTSDTMLSLLTTAEPYIRNQDPVVRKIGAERLRDATERFCKELIVKHRLLAGDTTASLSDYEGRNLRELRPLADAHLTDSAHPGKLQAITQWLNRGKHDDTVPTVGELQVCLGDLRFFRKAYLS